MTENNQQEIARLTAKASDLQWKLDNLQSQIDSTIDYGKTNASVKGGHTGYTGEQNNTAGYVFATRWYCPKDCTIDAAIFHQGNYNTAGAKQKAAVYSGTQIIPTLLLGQSSERITVANDLYSPIQFAFSTPISLTGGNWYWTVYQSDTTIPILYGINNSANGAYKNTTTYAGGFPSPWGVSTGITASMTHLVT
jgi:hypothetical protein